MDPIPVEEDLIKFICDECGKNKRIMSVCPKAGDAFYCSHLCRNRAFREHQKVCSHKTQMFQFCNYCWIRVEADDLCTAPGCEMTYVCTQCIINERHEDHCGKVCVSFAEVEKVLSTFRDVKIDGLDLVTAAINTIAVNLPETLVLTLRALSLIHI